MTIPVAQGTLLLIALFAALAVASWRDLRSREVPDLASLGLVVLGILGAFVAAIASKDPWLLAPSVAGAVAGLGIGLVLYHAKQWGGGDAKLLAGVGSVIGLWAPDWRLLSYVILLALCGALYGMGWTAWLVARSWKPFKAAFAQRLREPNVHRLRIALVSIGAVGIVAALLVDWQYQLLIGLALIGAYLGVYGWIASRTLEQVALVKTYPAGSLTEGDWLVEDVHAGKRVIARASSTGLTLSDIRAIRRAKVRAVRVREGIPFVPAFLLALVALLLLERTTAHVLALLALG